MTDANYTAMLIVLDRSGSMSMIREDMIGGIEQLIAAQRLSDCGDERRTIRLATRPAFALVGFGGTYHAHEPLHVVAAVFERFAQQLHGLRRRWRSVGANVINRLIKTLADEFGPHSIHVGGSEPGVLGHPL